MLVILRWLPMIARIAVLCADWSICQFVFFLQLGRPYWSCIVGCREMALYMLYFANVGEELCHRYTKTNTSRTQNRSNSNQSSTRRRAQEILTSTIPMAQVIQSHLRNRKFATQFPLIATKIALGKNTSTTQIVYKLNFHVSPIRTTRSSCNNVDGWYIGVISNVVLGPGRGQVQPKGYKFTGA